MKLKDFIQGFTQTAKDYIEKYEKYKELTGEQKKQRVDGLLKSYCETAIDNIGLNFVFKFVFKNLIIENIPNLTQVIFDLLEAKISGITK